MSKALTMLALLSYASTCLRLLCYRRGLANHRMHISLVAWLLIVATGTSALEILLGLRHPSFGETAVALILSYLAHRTQGNVAQLIRRFD